MIRFFKAKSLKLRDVSINYLVLSCNAHTRVRYLALFCLCSRQGKLSCVVYAHTWVSFLVLYMLTSGLVVLCYLVSAHTRVIYLVILYMLSPGSVILWLYLLTPGSVILCYLVMLTTGSVILYMLIPGSVILSCTCSHRGQLSCVTFYILTCSHQGQLSCVILYILAQGSAILCTFVYAHTRVGYLVLTRTGSHQGQLSCICSHQGHSVRSKDR